MILYALEPRKLDEQDDINFLSNCINFEPENVETLFNIAGAPTVTTSHL